VWIVVAYPPQLVPWSVERPESCPRCGATQPPTIHEHVNRTLPAVGRDQSEHDDFLVTRYNTVRFRCRTCGKTFTVPLPNRHAGFHLQTYVAARVVAWYCLGAVTPMIEAKLKDAGLPLSRATIYRLLKAAGPDLKRLHRANRARSRRVKHGRGRPRRPFEGTIEFVCEERFNWARVDVTAPEATLPALDVVARFTVDLVFLYGDALTQATIAWLDRYLRDLGHAGVLEYRSWDDVARAFAFAEANDINHFNPIDELLVEAAELQNLPSASSPLLRGAVRVALRTAAIDRADWHTAGKEKVLWRNRSDALLTVHMAEEEIFDQL